MMAAKWRHAQRLAWIADIHDQASLQAIHFLAQLSSQARADGGAEVFYAYGEESMKRIAYMVFSHAEWKGVHPTLHDAQDEARYFREQSGSGSVLRQLVSLKQLQDMLEHEIDDEEWDLYLRDIGENSDDRTEAQAP